MGCAITDLLSPAPLALSELSGKLLAVDAYNQLYMFLATIRGRDGALLQDRQGRVTSHLSGLFFRFTHLMGAGIKFAFIFDGKTPALKAGEQARRAATKQEAARRYETAKAAEDVEAMRKYAARTATLSPEMLAEAKALLAALGIPAVDAPAEGEAQAAALVRAGRAHAVLSQDADALLFGAPRIVKNLSVTGRRKLPGRPVTAAVEPELIDLNATLRRLQITWRQLVALGLLVGTDYNPGGIKGLGPKKSLTLVRQHGEDFDGLFSAVRWDEAFPYPWQAPFQLFLEMPVDPGAPLPFAPPDKDAVLDLLVGQHDFSSDSVREALARLDTPARAQRGLGDFF